MNNFYANFTFFNNLRGSFYLTFIGDQQKITIWGFSYYSFLPKRVRLYFLLNDSNECQDNKYFKILNLFFNSHKRI